MTKFPLSETTGPALRVAMRRAARGWQNAMASEWRRGNDGTGHVIKRWEPAILVGEWKDQLATWTHGAKAMKVLEKFRISERGDFHWNAGSVLCAGSVSRVSKSHLNDETSTVVPRTLEFLR